LVKRVIPNPRVGWLSWQRVALHTVVARQTRPCRPPVEKMLYLN
jgi:hypothetical protein